MLFGFQRFKDPSVGHYLPSSKSLWIEPSSMIEHLKNSRIPILTKLKPPLSAKDYIFLLPLLVNFAVKDIFLLFFFFFFFFFSSFLVFALARYSEQKIKASGNDWIVLARGVHGVGSVPLIHLRFSPSFSLSLFLSFFFLSLFLCTWYFCVWFSLKLRMNWLGQQSLVGAAHEQHSFLLAGAPHFYRKKHSLT